MKKYVIYLDESGDFDRDLEPGSHKNASLVGGFFYSREAGVDEEALKRRIIVSLSGENHATDIDREKKGLLVYDLLTSAKEYPIDFVIFQNDVKKKIVNSTQTYLTVITEGLIQLLKSLVITENEPIELDVIAGFRKDTTQPVTNSYVTGYISLSDYRERLVEKLSIEKAKLRSEDIQGSVIHIQLADDKRNTLLVLCDYICNFWYTRQASAFSAQVEVDGETKTVRTLLKPLYKTEHVFPLFNTEENEHVIRLVQDGVYADALFEACAGMLTETNVNRIRQGFIKLKPKQIHRQLSNLADYIGDLLIFHGQNALIERMLQEAEALYEFLVENGIEDARFYLDLEMYRLAHLSNTNQLSRMEAIFARLEKDVAKYTIQTLNIEYLLIFYTRKAVYLQDCRRYAESCKICDELEFILSMAEDAIKNSNFLQSENEIRSERLGKILGTKLQALIFLSYANRETYEQSAREISERAMDQFEFFYDLRRQYQYRADLEAVCGNRAEAFSWLEKSYGEIGWKEHLSGNRRTIFDLYHLLFVAALTKGQDQELSVEIANLVYQSAKEELYEGGALGSRCIWLLGDILCGDKRLKGRGRAALERMLRSGERVEEHIRRACEETLAGRDGLKAFFEQVDE
ncbi:MAG: hypothetical protein IJA58_07550 [Lachnospiraceae bacterium]|nr:hypothetical protein [Lachnospiraceae bacterium]